MSSLYLKGWKTQLHLFVIYRLTFLTPHSRMK